MKADPGHSTALVAVTPPELPNVRDDLRLQKLWLGLERRSWRSLAVLGASAGVETYEISELLAQLAWRYRGQPSSVCDLRDLGMRLVDYEIAEIGRQLEAGLRLIVALRSIFENPTAAPIARNVDAVLVCVALGDTRFKAAEETIAAVGRDRVVGSIVLRPNKVKPTVTEPEEP
ncbi:MAG TPA: hypothetical protein VKU41_11015 [Polyangiaceae bacterium]|nr:hypothetical protein [Polyangiaceae bacterium]